MPLAVGTSETCSPRGAGRPRRSCWWEGGLEATVYASQIATKSATESGINVADRALPITMELTFDSADTAARASLAHRYDIFAMSDCIIYIDQMGRITTRI